MDNKLVTSTHPRATFRHFNLQRLSLAILANNVFRLSHAFTWNDLWTLWETVGIIYLPRATYIPSLKFKQHSLLEISRLQSFHTLTSGDLKWPLTSVKNRWSDLLTMCYLHTMFEVQATFNSWDIMFTRFRDLTSGDLKWPLTSMKNNRVHLTHQGLATC